MRAWNEDDGQSEDSDDGSDGGNDYDGKMSLKERERWLEAEVEGCWRDVCVVAGLGAKMRALRVCVAGRWEREDRVREMEVKMKMER